MLGGAILALVLGVPAAVFGAGEFLFAFIFAWPFYGALLGFLVWCVLVGPWRLMIVIGGCIVLWPVVLGLLQGRFGAIPGDRFADTVVEMTFAGERLDIPRNFIDGASHSDRLGFYSVTLGFTLPELGPMTPQIAAAIIPPRSLKARVQRPNPKHYLKVRLEDANGSHLSRLLAKQPNLQAELPDAACVEQPPAAGLNCTRYLEITGNLWAVYTLEAGQPPQSAELDRRIRSIITSFVVEDK